MIYEPLKWLQYIYSMHCGVLLLTEIVMFERWKLTIVFLQPFLQDGRSRRVPGNVCLLVALN